MEQYTSEDARREWRRILNAVESGKPVGITRYGKPLAEVVPAGTWDNRATLNKVVQVALSALKQMGGDGALREISLILNPDPGLASGDPS